MHTFLQEAKRKQKWTTFARIHRLACQQNTLLCAPSILKHRFSRSLLIGTPVDFKRFEKRSVPTIDTKGKDSLDTLITQEMREDLQIDFSLEAFFGRFFWDPTEKRQYPNPPRPPPPPPKKSDLFSNWIGPFEICFRSSKMTDPRPCSTRWAYLEIYPVQWGHAKLKPTRNYQLQKSIFLRVKETSQNKTPNVYRTLLGRKIELSGVFPK